MTLARVNHPFRPMFNSLLNDIFEGDRAVSKLEKNWFSAPKVNIREDDRAFYLEVAAPGLSKENFEIKVDKDVLVVKGSKEAEQEEKQDTYYRKEFSYGVFERRFRLPETVNVEDIQAGYNEGILTVELPKLEAAQVESQRKIEVK
ncbi:MAG: Hsp20/alpha crystallin family protein [Bacteroidota bacterium]